MDNLQTIKSYLVALGFQVNQNEFNKLNQTLNDLSKSVQSVTSGMAQNFVKASTTIAGALLGVTTASAGLLDHVAQLDLGYQKFALRMYMTTEQAKQLKIVTDAMGENINDIAWIPELRQRYFALMGQARQLENQMPNDSEGGLKSIRDMRFEFTRLKVEATYAMQWIVYYLIKYLNGPLGNIKGGLKGLNDWLTQNMPVWTDKVARWLARVIHLVESSVEHVIKFKDELDKLWSSLSVGEKRFVALAAVIAEFLMSGPVGKIIILIGAIATLVEYLRKSGELGPLWNDLEKYWDRLRESIAESGLGDYFDKLSGKVRQLAQEEFKAWKDVLGSIFDIVGKELSKNGALTALYNMFGNIGRAVDSIVDGLIHLAKQMDLLPQNTKFQGFWKLIGDQLSDTVKGIAAFGNAISAVFEMIGLAMQGNWSAAASKGKSIFPNLWNDLKGPIFGSGGGGGSGNNHDYDDIIREASQRYGVPEDMIRRVINTESSWNAGARSSAGAIGLMQLMPDTAADMGVNDIYDPYQNIMGGTRYLAQMYKNENGDWENALRAYNGGPGWRTSGAANTQENQEYANKVLGMSASGIYSNLKASSLNFQNMTGANAYSYGAGGGYDNSMSIGGINIYITQPAATPDQIQSSVAKGIQDAQAKQNSRMIRSFSGVSINA